MLETIRGQPRVIDTLRYQLTSGRLHHAYIFHGPTGVGKFTTARAFARTLLCEDRPTPDQACGACEACRLTDRDDHPDLHVITKELARYSDDSTIRNRKLTTIPVQVLREFMIGPVHLSATRRGAKVFLVDEAELMAAAGQNALLKTLEEPPANTYLILVTAAEDKLLPTIRSRCQRLAFTPLPRQEIEAHLDRHGDELTAADRAWILEFADGSLGRAGLAIEYRLHGWAKQILPDLDRMAQGRFSPDMGPFIAESIDGFATRWVEEHKQASKEAANHQGAALMMSLIAQRARRRLRELAEQTPPGDPIAAERTMDPWLKVIDATHEASQEVASNVMLKTAADHLVSRMWRGLSGQGA